MLNTNKLISASLWKKHFANNQKYVVAVSGGKDSVTLLDYLVKRLKNPSQQIIVAHFNHQIRPDSHNDLMFVEALAKQHQLTFISQSVDIPTINKDNLEATARHFRYHFLEMVRSQFKLDYIVTAHHQDDQIETIILNYARGAGLKGLQGMSIYDPTRKLLRPFLQTPVSQIISYLKTKKLNFIQDQTNFDTKYTRNHLRQLVLPKLIKEYPDFNNTILDLSVLATQLTKYYLNQLNLRLLKTTDGYRFTRQKFQQLNTTIQLQFLYQCFQTFNLPTTKANLKKCCTLINQKSSGQKIESAAVTMWIDANHIHFTKNNKTTPTKTIQINLDSITNQKIINWNRHHLKITRTQTTTPNTMPLTLTTGIITIRNFLNGDRIKPLGLNGTQKLQDVLTNKKIPQRHRSTLPIITLNQEILGIPGIVTSESCRINNQNHCHFTVTLVDS